MFVDRPQKPEIIDGEVTTRPMDLMDVYLDRRDIELLATPSIAYTGDRFMGCTMNGAINGWAPEDKIHIRTEFPVEGTRFEDRFVKLSLDQGGDLYFTIWVGLTLFRASQHEEFPIDTNFVTSDPNNILRNMGIGAIRLHNLKSLGKRYLYSQDPDLAAIPERYV